MLSKAARRPVIDDDLSISSQCHLMGTFIATSVPRLHTKNQMPPWQGCGRYGSAIVSANGGCEMLTNTSHAKAG
jgi:hypothetical protein